MFSPGICFFMSALSKSHLPIFTLEIYNTKSGYCWTNRSVLGQNFFSDMRFFFFLACDCVVPATLDPLAGGLLILIQLDNVMAVASTKHQGGTRSLTMARARVDSDMVRTSCASPVEHLHSGIDSWQADFLCRQHLNQGVKSLHPEMF